MNSIELATRSLFKKGRHDGMKIISLGVGLAVALVLVAKMYFEQSFDRFYPDADRIYRLVENYSQNGNADSFNQVPGAVAPGMQAEVPGVEVVVAGVFEDAYRDARTFRDQLLLGGVATLIIALIGLIGYTNENPVNCLKSE